MKILVVGDKESSYIWDHFDPDRFKDIALIISTGDLRAEYLSFLVTMINVPLIYVPGNHDGLYETSAPEGCINIDGKMFKFRDLVIVGFGGSQRYNQGPYQYTDTQMDLRVKKLWFKLWRSRKIDILVSHAPALGLGDGSDLCHTGFISFRKLLDKYRPKFFVHGHQHMSYKDQKRLLLYKDTTIINSEGYYIFEI